mmetsp:Transcript_13814/g.29057  ORF Transcript_13814/g.29057 Transcript_13814/m.29057 type:complete len:112 (-) Transcript_13814:180-515(-)|eukprot:CAMPEP_0201137322 /NCGR_PEP_ID=MMETSP0850-20130426/55341_1 /ASSEMBLY_ACC=CAM_ASM_000622 /TAXON_ID=183588 /ORGANISM="Pseudo-nitzschia fraudulenta, Strain WWA7" /LENGTH=111 /DNA_ID=CAMNT_0047408665 /DNA_START=609 /DNA_END=944 /DNA_ORIENTATION=+
MTKPGFGDPGYVYDPMDPLPGEKFVEYSKNGEDGDVKNKGDPSGLEFITKGKFFFLSKVEHPAPAHNLHVGDRVLALNGKRIEKYSSLSAIQEQAENHNVVRILVSPTTLR